MFKKKNKILAKTPEQLKNIRQAGVLLTQLLGELRGLVRPGMTTMELEVYAERFLLSHNVHGAFKGYGGFPTNLCTSVNECVVHGVPDTTVLELGDLLTVDCGVTYQGGIADAAFSVVIGGDEQNPEAARMIRSTKEALDEGIQVIKAGVSGKTFGKHMRKCIEGRGLSVVKNLTGHGVGSDVHEEPSIYNRPQNGMKKRSFVEGQVIAIEPITALGSESYIERYGKKHNLYTEFGDLGAQWEYTLVVTKSGVEVLAGLRE